MSDKISNINWSNSGVSLLRQCSRKFYFANNVANYGRKNRLKRKAFELKQMQNLSMWQGSVVDKIMEMEIIPAIANKEELDFEAFADMAVDLAERRFQFSKDQMYLSEDINKGDAEEEYCILDVHEIGAPLDPQQLQNGYSNIWQSIINIPTILMPDNQTLLLDYLKKAQSLLPNVRNWVAKVEEANVNPQIDLLFYDEKWKPGTIDWKVSESWVSDYSRQLQIIGLVIFLKRLEKVDKKPYAHSEIKLFEVNLLNCQVKEHGFTEEIAEDLFDYINLTSSDIKLLEKDIEIQKLDIGDFDTTDNQSTCNFCNFRPLCSFLIRNKFQYDEDAYFKSLSGN